MEEIEVGDFVRTKKGKIFQYGKGRAYLGKDNAIVKHSFNIIDLIEVGDIVNGYRIDERAEYDVLIHKARGINRSGFMIPVAQYNEDIKTILTHEQYERNCYKAKEK